MAPVEEVEAIETRLLLQSIFDRYGYDFRGYAMDSMARRVSTALAKSGLEHLGELQHRILVDSEFFNLVLGDLTVQVSEMFRDPIFQRTFREQVVPILKTYPHIKIWHAGCAFGEELYTTAITLSEAGLLDRTQLYATDINPRAIEIAREGVYPEAQRQVYEANYLAAGGTMNPSDYYTHAYGGITFKESLRDNIVFFQHDLVSDYALGEMQVIFCRNVLIYFGAELRARVIAMFDNGLCRGGFLCLGDSEHLPTRAGPFEDFLPGHRIYRKVGV